MNTADEAESEILLNQPVESQTIPYSQRVKWLPKLQHHRATLLLCGSLPSHSEVINSTNQNNSNSNSNSKHLYCYPNAPVEAKEKADGKKIRRMERSANKRELKKRNPAVEELSNENDEGEGEDGNRNNKRRDDKETPYKLRVAASSSDDEDGQSMQMASTSTSTSTSTGEPLLPSQIVANARANGEIPLESKTNNSTTMPPLPPGMSADLDQEMNDNDDNDDDDDDDYSGSDSDSESSDNDSDEQDENEYGEKESSFKNTDKTLPGPELVGSRSSSKNKDGIHLVRMFEEGVKFQFFQDIADVPIDTIQALKQIK